MENAVDALSMAFAILVFILAIALSFALFSQVNAVSKTVLHVNDNTNYVSEVDFGRYQQFREVGIDDVIATLYSYSTELYMVTVDLGNGRVYDFYLRNENWIRQKDIKTHLDAFVGGGDSGKLNFHFERNPENYYGTNLTYNFGGYSYTPRGSGNPAKTWYVDDMERNYGHAH